MNKHGSFTQVILSNKKGGKTSLLAVSQLQAHVLGLNALPFLYINRLLTTEFLLFEEIYFFKTNYKKKYIY